MTAKRPRANSASTDKRALMRASMPAFLADAGALDRESHAPLWLLLKNLLADAMERHALPLDSPLPSESDLCLLYEVSRPVVRAALDGLVREGRIVKIHRRGAFVAKPKQALDFASSNIGLFGDLAAKGHQVKARVLELQRAAPDVREREMLGLPQRSEVLRVTRLYLSDGVPMATGTIVYPGHRVIGLESMNLTDRSMYATLRKHYGLIVAQSERWLRAAMPTPEQAELLALPPATPVIEIESIGRLSDGTPFEYYNTVYCTHDSRMHIVTTQSGAATAPAKPAKRGAK
jgi:GntR family transcriptional regulator